MLEPIILFALGGAGYQAIELAWRGTTHWTMFAAGGLACCYLLHLAVWDYSALWGNVAGLVCPLYSFYWFLLCFWVLLVLRGAENLTERPLYRITKWATET